MGSYFAKLRRYNKNHNVSIETNLYYQLTYLLFCLSALYCSSFLPYGRFYNRLGGNVGMLFSYFYLFCYLTFPSFRRNVYFEMVLIYIENVSQFCKNSNINLRSLNNFNYKKNLLFFK